MSWKQPSREDLRSRGIEIVRNRYQATTSKKHCGLEKKLSVCASELQLAMALYEVCVKVVNKSNIQTKTPFRVTHTRYNILFIHEGRIPLTTQNGGLLLQLLMMSLLGLNFLF
jgi:hypothetical protein